MLNVKYGGVHDSQIENQGQSKNSTALKSVLLSMGSWMLNANTEVSIRVKLRIRANQITRQL